MFKTTKLVKKNHAHKYHEKIFRKNLVSDYFVRNLLLM